MNNLRSRVHAHPRGHPRSYARSHPRSRPRFCLRKPKISKTHVGIRARMIHAITVHLTRKTHQPNQNHRRAYHKKDNANRFHLLLPYLFFAYEKRQSAREKTKKLAELPARATDWVIRVCAHSNYDTTSLRSHFYTNWQSDIRHIELLVQEQSIISRTCILWQ